MYDNRLPLVSARGRQTADGRRQVRNLSGNIVAMALILTTALLVAGIGIGIVAMEGSARAKEADNAVAAYYMANSGVEMQLYAIRKDNRSLAYVATASSSYPGATKWISTTGFEKSTIKTFALVPKEQFVFIDLFDPDNIAATSSVSKVVISWDLDPTDCILGVPPDMEVGFAEWQFSGGGVTWPDASADYTILPFTASPMTITAPTIDPTKAYRMRLRPFKCNASNVNIRMYDSLGAPLNYPGDITLGSEGTYGQTTQKLTVSMPRQNILSGIFSYIVFSQEALCKKVGAAGACP